VADVVAHEVAHMWFGDLTTMSWWTGIWLNEAFATFAEMLAVDAWKPQWKRWESFGAFRAAALTVDGLSSTRPIEYPVRKPEECNGMFDVLTYQKGGSVLRMLEQYLTVPVFQKGISLYLNRHQYANTETSDLWAALAEASGQPVVDLMQSWIFAKGYPMVTVDLDESGKKLKVSQQRFFYLSEKSEEQLFHVPIMIRAGSGSGQTTLEKRFLLTTQQSEVDLGQAVDWVVVNEGGHGFYRVNYAPKLRARLQEHLFSVLRPIERFNFVNDSWAMTLAGHVSLADYLKLAQLFKEEEDKNVWSILLGSLNYIDRIVDDKARKAFESFVCKLLEPIYKRLGWEPAESENELTGQLRGLVISALGCLGNHDEVKRQAVEAYARYKTDKAAIDSNIVSAVVSILAVNGDAKRYEEFVQSFETAKTPQEEDRYLYSLAAFRDQALLTRTLESCMNGKIRSQSAPFVIRDVMLNRQGRRLGFDLARSRWDEIQKLFAASNITRMWEGVIGLVDEKLAQEVGEFFAKNPVPQGPKQIEQHQERLAVAVRLLKREGANLEKALQ
jgi:puromycin-sensitive aminopeptidase